MQVACLGLIKAIDRFDREREVVFSSYAVPTILGELKRHFRDRTWSVRVPRDLQELALRVDRAVTQLSIGKRRSPSVGEIAAPSMPPRSRCSRRWRPPAPTARARSTRRARRSAGRTRREPRRHARRGGGRLPARRGARHARAAAGADLPPRAPRARAALRPGPHAGRDRRAHRRLPDAGLAAHPPSARAHARRGRRRGGRVAQDRDAA